MEVENSLLLDVEAYVTNYISEQVPKEYAYHDVQHTLDVVASVKEIGQTFELNKNELEILTLAAWFHDTGYDKGALNHEERSAKYAEDYLTKYNYSPENLQVIKGCIMATKMPHTPETLLQRIICDADLSHLGQNVYWDRCSRLRQEMTLTNNSVMSELEWIDFELKFINQHNYQTTVAQQLYGKKKVKHIRQLQKQRWRLSPHEVITVEEMAKRDEIKRKKKKGKKKNNQNGINDEMGGKEHQSRSRC